MRERTLTDMSNTVRKDDGSEFPTSFKCPVADMSNAVRKDDGGETAGMECIISNIGDTIRNDIFRFFFAVRIRN